jgi:hypothetical protein
MSYPAVLCVLTFDPSFVSHTKKLNMGSDKLGIDALVDLAVDAIEAGREIAPALADGLQLTDAMVVIGNFNRLKRIVENAKPALQEIKDLTGDEAQKAAMEISIRAHIPDDGTALGIAGKAIKLAARTYRQVEASIDLAQDWQELFKKDAAG